ncbi:MAG: hypothetical protein BWK77_08565 [Verrucomicrobia bacterium A1]|nr:MAG: hypothetical protein BWK77_08565 [Verrucomicrobia bacterium A1]
MLVAGLGMVVATESAPPATPPAPEKVRISATKKTEAARHGAQKSLPNASRRVDEDDMFYRFEVQRVALDVPEDLRIRYMVVVEGLGGRLRIGATKEEELVLSGMTPVPVDSDPVTLRSIEWNRGRRGGSGENKEKLYGWSVRVLDAKGGVVAEKFQPKDLEAQAEKLVKQWKEDEGKPPRPLR